MLTIWVPIFHVVDCLCCSTVGILLYKKQLLVGNGVLCLSKIDGSI